MFRKISDFEKTWTNHVQGTMKVLNAMTQASMSQPVADGHRTLGRLAWHNVTTIAEMAPYTGLKFTSVSKDAPMPGTLDEIRKAYADVTLELLQQIKAHWTDETLLQEDDLYGEKWARGMTLYVLIVHEVHHRGQMTVLMRQAGLSVPGVFGPAKEEWEKFGMKAPEI
jgi:uncharacterized damage-inducible protein DinB